MEAPEENPDCLDSIPELTREPIATRGLCSIAADSRCLPSWYIPRALGYDENAKATSVFQSSNEITSPSVESTARKIPAKNSQIYR